MKVTLNWLREFVPIELSVDCLANRLTLAGLEVEDISEQGDIPVQIGQIVRIAPHPQADHLVVCHLTTGGETIPVVCGAPNTRVGDKVAFAPEGTTLPTGVQVDRMEIRGQVSCGMLCSEAELGLSDDQSGLLILPSDAPLGKALFPFLGLRDTVLDVALTPNRGDCLSIVGLAREIAALTGAPLSTQKLHVQQTGEPIDQQVHVSILDPDVCPRYAARVVRGVTVAQSPLWMRWRLEAVGIRALNNLVDVTNYVMIERGQPLHAFDLPSLAGAEIIVRRARDIPSIITLDGQERHLVPDDLLICDRDQGVAIAGVMGGANSEVRDDTTEVLLESAYFVPETVRRTARRLSLRSEASYRFERGVDPQGTVLALDRAASLLIQLAGGYIDRGVIDAYPRPIAGPEIRLRAQRVNTFLGVSVEPLDVEQRLRSLGAAVQRTRPGEWGVTAPPHRSDLTQEVDLIEEIARLGDYEKIPTLQPKAEVHAEKMDSQGLWAKRVRSCLAAQGLTEMVHFSFTSARLNALFPGILPDARPIAILNPLATDGAELRVSLLGGLAHALQNNLRQGENNVAAFELGKVFFTSRKNGEEKVKHEQQTLAGILFNTWPMAGLRKETAQIGFTDLKGVLETLWQALHCRGYARWTQTTEIAFLHPGKAALLTVDGTPLGVAGALHPNHCAELELSPAPWLFELDFTTLLHYARAVTRYQPLPRFPAVVRDFAIVTDDDLPVQTVMDAVRELNHPLIETMQLFDLYRGSPIPTHRKSLAYSIAYRAVDRTLTADEVNALHEQVVAHIVQVLKVEIRI